MNGISSKALNFGNPSNKYKFNNGTELNSDFDINLYETNFRSLDPQIGRFWQADPMADATFQFSPYSFANNNPLTFNDPLGLYSDTTINGEHYPDAKTLDNVTVTAKRKVPDEFAPYISFPNGKPYSIASFKDWPLSFSRDRSNDLLDSWAMGLGAANRVYLPKHPMTKRLINAYQVNLARAFFYRKYLTDYKNGISLKGASVTNYKGSFGLVGIVAAGFDLVEQFVGSMNIDIQVDEKGENLLFIVSNTTSESSAFYHMADSHERSPGNEAMGNLYQVYIWKEPISSLGFSDVTSPRTSQASPTTGIPGAPFQ
jgi:RHS repeat-associated protein